MTETRETTWPGFWSRLGAFVVDGLILGGVGYAIGAVAFDRLAALGVMGRLIGLAISTVYFGLLTSKLGGGRSLGHRLLKLRVAMVDGSGAPGLLRALGRAMLLELPIILNGFFINDASSIWAIVFGFAAVTLVFGVGLAQIYLLLFGGPDRRLVHDLVFGTAVTRARGPIPSPRSGMIHRAVASGIVAVVFAACFALPTVGMNLLPGSLKGSLGALRRPMQAVSALPEVLTAGASDNTTTMFGDHPRTTRTLVVNARLRSWPAHTDQEIARIARTVLPTYNFVPGQRLQIVLTYGFELGIASGSRSSFDTEDPNHWRPPPATPPASPGPGPKQAA